MLNAARGPSSAKTLKRRIEMVKERHGDVIAANAQAQIRKLFANRSTSQIEGIASTIIPKPALLRKRLEMTGRDIALSKYLMVSMMEAMPDGRRSGANAVDLHRHDFFAEERDHPVKGPDPAE